LDVVSRLLKDRILLLGTDVNDEVANVLVAQLLFLANQDPDKDITLYINSPGGSVSAGLAIYDTMKFIPCDVQTVWLPACVWLVAFPCLLGRVVVSCPSLTSNSFSLSLLACCPP
jgi:ATP-dependent Clp endopeptidase proteolytic subunit ClpP